MVKFSLRSKNEKFEIKADTKVIELITDDKYRNDNIITNKCNNEKI